MSTRMRPDLGRERGWTPWTPSAQAFNPVVQGWAGDARAASV